MGEGVEAGRHSPGAGHAARGGDGKPFWAAGHVGRAAVLTDGLRREARGRRMNSVRGACSQGHSLRDRLNQFGSTGEAVRGELARGGDPLIESGQMRRANLARISQPTTCTDSSSIPRGRTLPAAHAATRPAARPQPVPGPLVRPLLAPGSAACRPRRRRTRSSPRAPARTRCARCSCPSRRSASSRASRGRCSGTGWAACCGR
ncbi:MAG: hypothetical protein RI988_2493 [Pseudomonadota bacterium]